MDLGDAAAGGGAVGVAGGIVAAVREYLRRRADAREKDREERLLERREDRITKLEERIDQAAKDCDEKIGRMLAESEDACAKELAAQRADLSKIAQRVAEQRRTTMPAIDPDDTGLHELEAIASRTPTPPRSFPPVRPAEIESEGEET